MTRRTLGAAQIITGVAAAIALLHFLASILIPFVIAFVLAVLVNALVRFIQNLWAAAPAWGGVVACRARRHCGGLGRYLRHGAGRRRNRCAGAGAGDAARRNRC